MKKKLYIRKSRKKSIRRSRKKSAKRSRKKSIRRSRKKNYSIKEIDVNKIPQFLIDACDEEEYYNICKIDKNILKCIDNNWDKIQNRCRSAVNKLNCKDNDILYFQTNSDVLAKLSDAIKILHYEKLSHIRFWPEIDKVDYGHSFRAGSRREIRWFEISKCERSQCPLCDYLPTSINDLKYHLYNIHSRDIEFKDKYQLKDANFVDMNNKDVLSSKLYDANYISKNYRDYPIPKGGREYEEFSEFPSDFKIIDEDFCNRYACFSALKEILGKEYSCSYYTRKENYIEMKQMKSLPEAEYKPKIFKYNWDKKTYEFIGGLGGLRNLFRKNGFKVESKEPVIDYVSYNSNTKYFKYVGDLGE